MLETKTQTIDIRVATGGAEYTWPLTITENSPPEPPFNGPKDISVDVVRLSVGTDAAPGAWLTPDVDRTAANKAGAAKGVLNQRIVQLLVGVGLRPADGIYRLWSKVGDLPETVPRRHCKITIRNDA